MRKTQFFFTVVLAVSQWNSSAQSLSPIACNLNALTAAQRTDLKQRSDRMIAAISGSRELKDGYAFRFDSGKASLIDVAHWLDLWRRCCPFYEFHLDFQAANADIELSVEGRPGVKEFIPLDSPQLAAKLPKSTGR
jgi:hypothetical protein